MINLNPSALANVMDDSIFSSRVCSIHFFSGEVPADSLIDDALSGEAYYASAIKTALSLNLSNHLGYIQYANTTQGIQTEDGISFEFASRPEEVVVLDTSENVGFALVMFHNSSTPIANTEIMNYLANQLILGSVGDTGSGADFELKDLRLSEDVVFKVNDLNLNISF